MTLPHVQFLNIDFLKSWQRPISTRREKSGQFEFNQVQRVDLHLIIITGHLRHGGSNELSRQETKRNGTACRRIMSTNINRLSTNQSRIQMSLVKSHSSRIEGAESNRDYFVAITNDI